MTENLEKLKKDLENNSKSLSSKMTDLKTKISTMRSMGNTVLLCDTSGSMDSLIYEDNKESTPKRAVEVLQEVLDNFVGARIYEFNSWCKKVSTLGAPRGGTNMAGAIYKVHADGIKEVILLTDGAPDSESLTLEAAKVTRLKISIIYIGPKPTPSFLERLAQASHGKFTSVELMQANAVKEIENKIKGFISA